MDREGLWYKVLSLVMARRGGELIRGRDGSTWWRVIVKIHEGIGVEGGSSFEKTIHMKIRNGLNTFFLSDCCVGASRFRRLFLFIY